MQELKWDAEAVHESLGFNRKLQQDNVLVRPHCYVNTLLPLQKHPNCWATSLRATLAASPDLAQHKLGTSVCPTVWHTAPTMPQLLPHFSGTAQA